jgi:hypothetical protein
VDELGIGACVHLQDERHDSARVRAALDIAVSRNSGRRRIGHRLLGHWSGPAESESARNQASRGSPKPIWVAGHPCTE